MKVRRVPVTEEHHDGSGEVAVLVGDRVLVLSALATFLVSEAGTDWVEVSELATRLEQEYGSPPGDQGALTATTKIVDDLAADGLLETSDTGDRPNG
jgi:hypothetical protein